MAWKIMHRETSIVSDHEIITTILFEGDFADRHADTVVATTLHLLNSLKFEIDGDYQELVEVPANAGQDSGEMIRVWHTPSITFDFNNSGLRRTAEGTWVFAAKASVHKYWGGKPMIDRTSDPVR